MRGTAAAVVLAMLVAACGSKSGLEGGLVDSSDSGPDDAPIVNPDPSPELPDDDNLVPASGRLLINVGGPGAPSVGGPNCPVIGYMIPRPGEEERLHLVDGQAGNSVSCRVAASPSSAIEAKLVTPYLTFQISGLTIPDRWRGVGTMTFTEPAQFEAPLTDTNCRFEVEPLDDRGYAGFAPGTLRASFTCDALASPEGYTCSSNGFIRLENCDKR